MSKRYELLLTLAALLVAAPVSGQRGGPTLPEGEGRDLVHAPCGNCHGLNNIAGSV